LVSEGYELIDELYLGKEIDGFTGSKKYGYGFYDISQDNEYIDAFRGFLSKYPYPIVAHNCPFDKKFLVYYGWVKKDYPFYCSMRAIRNEVSSLESYSMSALVSHFNIADETDHQAMSDVLNLHKLLKMIQPKHWIPVGATKQKSRRWPSKIKPRKIEDIDLPIPTTGVLAGETVCFTGQSDYPRHTMQEIALKNGAELSSNVTLKTTMLVLGSGPGSKLDKARARGLFIIPDKEFFRMLGLTETDKESV